MAITFWRNVLRKLTTSEMDANFDTLVTMIDSAGLSDEMPEGQIYIGDNTNTASLETLDTSIVPETTDKRYQSDLQDTYNDATSSIQDQLDAKEDLITKNATNTPLVWTSANGVASFQPIPVLGDLTYYLTNTASDVATYYKQTTTPQVALTSLPFASVTDGQLLATFISEPNNPNRTSIPDGQYLNHLHLGKTGGTKDLQVRAEMWEVTSAGVDIVKLADLGPSTVLVGSGSTEYIIGYNTVEKTLSSVTSRIATKIYAVVSGGGSAPSISIFQGDGSDSRSNLPAPVVDATNYIPYTGALNDVDLGGKNITTTDIIVSGATALTIAHFDATKNVESLLTATYPNLTELSYVKGVTSAIQTQIDARSVAYAIPNYYRVDLNLGDDLTGVAGREDKPYRLIQTVWDLIPTSSTAQITIEIVGDFAFETHAVNTSVNKDNVTFLFKGKIVYAVTATTTSRPLFTFSGTNNNLTFIVPNYTQTTQGGFIYTNTSSGHRYIIDNMQILLGIDASLNNNYGFRSLGATNESYFQCNSMTVSLTGDGSALKGFSVPLSLPNCIYNINIFNISGTPSVASTYFTIFYGTVKSINIKKVYYSVSTYTNLAGLSFCDTLTCAVTNVDDIEVVSHAGTKIYAFFGNSTATNIYNIKKLSLLNTQTIFGTEFGTFNFGYVEQNGYLIYPIIFNGTLNFEYFKSIAFLGYLSLKSKTKINGVGRGIWEYTNTTNSAGPLLLASSDCNSRISNVTFYGSGMQTGNVAVLPPIMLYLTGSKLRLDNVIFSSNLDTNTHANTTPIVVDSGATGTIEGNFATNYLKNITGVTNNCKVSLISNYII
jgi:hypothetical protein